MLTQIISVVVIVDLKLKAFQIQNSSNNQYNCLLSYNNNNHNSNNNNHHKSPSNDRCLLIGHEIIMRIFKADNSLIINNYISLKKSQTLIKKYKIVLRFWDLRTFHKNSNNNSNNKKCINRRMYQVKGSITSINNIINNNYNREEEIDMEL